jgi:hypothetical protein
MNVIVPSLFEMGNVPLKVALPAWVSTLTPSPFSTFWGETLLVSPRA